jgi:hypothetical protein
VDCEDGQRGGGLGGGSGGGWGGGGRHDAVSARARARTGGGGGVEKESVCGKCGARERRGRGRGTVRPQKWRLFIAHRTLEPLTHTYKDHFFSIRLSLIFQSK